MALGTYTVDNGKTAETYIGANYSMLYRVSFSQDVILKSMITKFYGTGTWQGVPLVYSSTGTLIHQGSTQTIAVANTTTLYEISYPDITLTAGTTYAIGCTTGATTALQPALASPNQTGTVITSSPTFASMTIQGGASWTSGTAYSNNNYTYTMAGGFSFNNANTLPAAPTALSSNTPVLIGNPLTVNWTHNDVDGNQASKYQIRYRKKDV